MEREVEEGEKRNSNIVSRKWGARGRKRTCSKVTVVGGGGGGGGTYWIINVSRARDNLCTRTVENGR